MHPLLVTMTILTEILCWGFGSAMMSNEAVSIETTNRLMRSVLAEVLEENLANCHLVYITQDVNGREFSSIVSYSNGTDVPAAFVSIKQLNSISDKAREDLMRYIVLGDMMLTCRVLVLLLEDSSSSPGSLGNFLEKAGLHFWPHTHIIGVGDVDKAESFLLHRCFRNTIRALYLASIPDDEDGNKDDPCEGCDKNVLVYSRCLYCHGGNAGVRVINKWIPGIGFHKRSSFFPEDYEDMMGHTMQVTAKDLFPFIEYELHTQELGTTVTPLDSLDVRMLNITADLLNFTYVMRMPMDDEWGTFEDGKWTGMVYTLQQNLADISMMLFWAYERKQVIDFTRIYINEPFVMVTRKPKPAPQHLALIRPFQGEVWLSVILMTSLISVIFWGLQRIWRSFSGFPSPSFDTALMNIWGIVLEDPLMIMPSNDTGRILLGWWMMFAMLVLSVYKSSLVAHLSVAVIPPPIDTVEQLVAVEGASWGMEPGSGLGWDWFKYNENPNVMKMFKTLEMMNAKKQMERVLEGDHAFFTWKYYVKTIIGSNFTAGLGYTPIHISREEFIPGPTGWGVRKGAPFLDSLDRLQDKLVEAGIVDYWLRELFETAIWKGRMNRKYKTSAGEEEENKDFLEETKEGAVVLNLNHLQGAFYILFLGIGLATIFAFGENIFHASLTRQGIKSVEWN